MGESYFELRKSYLEAYLASCPELTEFRRASLCLELDEIRDVLDAYRNNRREVATIYSHQYKTKLSTCVIRHILNKNNIEYEEYLNHFMYNGYVISPLDMKVLVVRYGKAYIYPFDLFEKRIPDISNPEVQYLDD